MKRTVCLTLSVALTLVLALGAGTGAAQGLASGGASCEGYVPSAGLPEGQRPCGGDLDLLQNHCGEAWNCSGNTTGLEVKAQQFGVRGLATATGSSNAAGVYGQSPRYGVYGVGTGGT